MLSNKLENHWLLLKKNLNRLLGMYFGMGLVRMLNSRMYWENDTRYAPVADIMSRN